MTDAPARPCRCHKSHAYISPVHDGHCCFLPASQNCHPAEFQAWLTKDARIHGYDPQERVKRWLAETGGETVAMRP